LRYKPYTTECNKSEPVVYPTYSSTQRF